MSSQKPVVLIIDDDASVRQSMVGCLNDLGMKTITAADGRAGFEAFRRERPDVVVLDLRLPEMDGLDVLKGIRKNSADASVIVVSGKGLMPDAIEALRLGASDYLVKPIHDLAVLEHSVRKALERIRLMRENRQYRDHLAEQVKLRTAQLQNANDALRAKHMALTEVLATVEAEKQAVGRHVLANVEKLVMPLLRSLRAGLSRPQERLLDQVEASLGEIVSPFTDKISRELASLTPAEIRICNFVRNGLGVKEIADIEHVSPETVGVHRRNIRRKLGVAHKKVNLTTYLRTLIPGGIGQKELETAGVTDGSDEDS